MTPVLKITNNSIEFLIISGVFVFGLTQFFSLKKAY